MRKRYRVLIFAALVAALIVPVGYALSVESMPSAALASADYATVAPAGSLSSVAAAVVVPAPMTIPEGGVVPAASSLVPASDAARLFGIGTLLFGLAAFLRKAN